MQRKAEPLLNKKTELDTLEKIVFTNNDVLRKLFGEQDRNIRLIEKLAEVNLAVRGNVISISGDRITVALIRNLLSQLYEISRKGYPVFPADIEYAHRILSEDGTADLERIFLDTVFISSKKRIITPKSIAQKLYIDAIRNSDMVFGIGPAGTGKTYLAMAMAISALLEKKVNRISLARPAVEAGEKLGFLPGDLAEKVNPYLRPLYDALFDMIDFDRASALIHKGVIEVAPLAFMRGRTLERLLRHPRRGPEYDIGTDEDVPDEARIWFQGRDYRGCDADRSPDGQDVRSRGSGRTPQQNRGHPFRPLL